MSMNVNSVVAYVWSQNDKRMDESGAISNVQYTAADVHRLMDKYYAARTTLRLTDLPENKTNIYEITARIWEESVNRSYSIYMVRKMIDAYYTVKLVSKYLDNDDKTDKTDKDVDES